MNIQEVRQKYPEYDDLDDQTLADALHRKFYADIPKYKVYEKLGVEQRALPPQDMGILGVLGKGVENTGNMIGTAFNAATGDYAGVEERAKRQRETPGTIQSEAFRKELESRPEGGLWQEVKNVAGAAVDQPEGAFDEMLMQLPNSGVVLGSAGAGAGAGALVAGPIGAIVGGVIGMFAGNAGIETGAMAQQYSDDGEFTPDERAKSLKEGAIKGGVITGIDAATLGTTRLMAGAPGRVASSAVTKFLADKGVDVASSKAVRRAITANPSLVGDAMKAGAAAVGKNAKLPSIAASSILEPLSEGTGEYFGELAAGRDASVREAVLEAALSMPQSAIEIAGARTGVQKNATEAAGTKLTELGGGKKKMDRVGGIAQLVGPRPEGRGIRNPLEGDSEFPVRPPPIEERRRRAAAAGAAEETGQLDMFGGASRLLTEPNPQEEYRDSGGNWRSMQQEQQKAAVQENLRRQAEQQQNEQQKKAQITARQLRTQNYADERAFKGKDLFPAELGQASRRGRPVEPRPTNDRRATPQPADPRQLGIEDEIELNTMQAAEDAKVTQANQLRQRSELETLEAQRRDNRERQQKQKRLGVLQNVVQNNTNPDYRAVTKAYEAELENAGAGVTTATEAEAQSIRNAVNVQFATEKKPVETTLESEERKDTPEQNAPMETAVAPKAPVQQTGQMSFEGMGQRGKVAEPTEPVAGPRVVDDNFLNKLAIGLKNPVRDVVRGKDLSIPAELEEVKQALSEYANNPRVPKKARELIPSTFAGLTGEQIPMLGPRGGILPGAKGKRGGDRVSQQPTGQAEPAPTGAGVSANRGSGGQAVPATDTAADTTGATVPDTDGLATIKRSTPPAEGRTREEAPPLAAYQVEEVADGNWAFGDTVDGTFEAVEEGFASEAVAKQEAAVEAVRQGRAESRDMTTRKKAATKTKAKAKEAEKKQNATPIEEKPAEQPVEETAEQPVEETAEAPPPKKAAEKTPTKTETKAAEKPAPKKSTAPGKTTAKDTTTNESEAKPKAESKPKPLVEGGGTPATADVEYDIRDGDWFDKAGLVPYSYLYDMPKIKVNAVQNKFVDDLLYGEKLSNEDASPQIQTVQAYLKHYLTFPQALATALYEIQHKIPEYKLPLRVSKDVNKQDLQNMRSMNDIYERTGGKYAEEFVEFAEKMGEGVKPFIDSVNSYELRRITAQENVRAAPSERYQITAATYRLNKAAERLESGKRVTYLDKVLDELNEALKLALGGGKNRTVGVIDENGKPKIKVDKYGKPILKNGKPQQETKRIDNVADPIKTREIKFMQAKAREIVGGEDLKRVSGEQKQALDEVIKELRALPMAESAIDVLEIEMHPAVIGHLKDGNLRQALIALELTAATDDVYKLTGSDTNLLKTTARRFANKIGDTKVVIRKNLKHKPTGKRVAGMFDPETNTVLIDQEYASSPQTLIHEVAHALTAQVLVNKSHPVTKQLQAVLDSVKDELSSYYGTKDVGEFVAEFYANPRFQQELQRLLDKDGKSAWQKIVESISKFLHKMLGIQQPVDSPTYNELVEITNSILAPAPEFMAHNQIPLIRDDIAEDVKDRYGQWHKDLERPSIKRLGQLAKELMTRDSTKALKHITWFSLPMQALSDVAGWYDKGAGAITSKIYKMLLEHQGALTEADTNMDATLADLRNYARRQPNESREQAGERMAKFDKFVHESSFEEYHPSPQGVFSKYKDLMKKKYKDNPQEQAKFDELGKQWRALGAEGQKTYWKLITTYSDVFDNMKDALERKIDSLEVGDSETKKMKNRLAEELFKKERIFPYVPFFRTGNYWLEFMTKDSAEPQIMAFEREFDRNNYIEVLKSDPNVDNESIEVMLEKGALTKASRGSPAPTQTFISDILKIMDANKASESEKDQVTRLFISMLPETSFAKSLQRREGKLGYKEDSILAFRHKAYDMARQVVQVNYSTKLLDAQKEFGDYILGADDTKPHMSKDSNLATGGNAALLENEIQKRIQFAIAPPNDLKARMVRKANRYAFLGTIGFNLSSAAVNLSQIPMVVLPHLAGTTSWSTATKSIARAIAIHHGAGRDYKVQGYGKNTETELAIKGNGHSIGNWYRIDNEGQLSLRKDEKTADITKERKAELEDILPLVQHMHDHGILNRSLFYDTTGAETSGKSKEIGDYVAAASALFFHNTERLNRETAMMAAYFNERARQDAGNLRPEEKGMSAKALQDAAVENAVYIGHQTNGGAVLTTAPRIAQQGIMRVAMMYKSYGVTMYYNQFKLLHDGYFSKLPIPKEQQREAQRQFWNTQLMVLAMSGVSGLTITGIVEAIMDALADDDDLPANLQMQKMFGPEFYKGGLNQMTKIFGGEGIDVSSRIGLANLLYQTNRYDFDPSAEKSIVRALGGPAYGFASQQVRGANDILSGEYRRGIENALPAAFRNLLKAERFAEEGPLTRRHDPITGDLGAGLLFGQAFGFAPAEYVRNQERNMALKGIDRKSNEKRTKILRDYYLAMRVGGPDEVSEVRKDIDKFNERWPQYKIDRDTINRSMKQHRETTHKMYNGVLFSPKLRREMEMLGDEMDQW